MEFEQAIIELLKLKKEASKHTLVVLGRLSGLTERQAKAKLKELHQCGKIYVTRREDIIKLT